MTDDYIASLEKVFFAASRFVRTDPGTDDENEASSDLAYAVTIVERNGFLRLIDKEIDNNMRSTSPADELQLSRIAQMLDADKNSGG